MTFLSNVGCNRFATKYSTPSVVKQTVALLGEILFENILMLPLSCLTKQVVLLN